jgi:hypothetical protein
VIPRKQCQQGHALPASNVRLSKKLAPQFKLIGTEGSGTWLKIPEIAQRALAAKRESKYIEFKEAFDPTSNGDWCEVIKDIVAIANSGGGIIAFGLDNTGNPTAARLDALAHLDPADVSNKISKYVGSVPLEFEVLELTKNGCTLYAFVIQPASIPIIFQKPGTYDIGSGKQRTAFSVGTVYFRHGAKSEPGNSDDIRTVIERQLEFIRRSWIKGVRKVVQAPQGSQIVAVRPGATSPLSPTVRVVNDPRATPVLLTRDPSRATTGTFVHEEVSEAIFDEINNVIDANRVLARGQCRFFLGPPVYYRIYAERQHVKQRVEHMTVLLHSAICDFYAPALFWTLSLSPKNVAGVLSELYLRPRSPGIHSLIRVAALLGPEFCDWLFARWHSKWKNHAQPPNFYWSFQQMRSKISDTDHRILAARLNTSSIVVVSGQPATGVSKLLDNPGLASSLLSTACMEVFQGDASLRSTARNLDYLAYGLLVRDRAKDIGDAIIELIGDQEAGDLGESASEDERIGA